MAFKLGESYSEAVRQQALLNKFFGFFGDTAKLYCSREGEPIIVVGKGQFVVQKLV